MSRVVLTNETEVSKVLEDVNNYKLKWALFHHQSRSQIAFSKSGTCLESLVQEFPKDEVLYAVVTFQCPMDGNMIPKFLLVTMVGEFTSPMKKAMSSATRIQLFELLKAHTPVQSHFQANECEEICEEEFIAKLRVNPSARAKWKRQAGERYQPGRSGCSHESKVNFGNSGSVKIGSRTHADIVDRAARNEVESHIPRTAPPAFRHAPPAPPTLAVTEQVDQLSLDESAPRADLERVVTDASVSSDISAASSAASEIAFCGECGTRREGQSMLFCHECGSRYE